MEDNQLLVVVGWDGSQAIMIHDGGVSTARTAHTCHDDDSDDDANNRAETSLSPIVLLRSALSSPPAITLCITLDGRLHMASEMVQYALWETLCWRLEVRLFCYHVVVATICSLQDSTGQDLVV